MTAYGVSRLLPWLQKIIDTHECGTLVGLPGSGKRRSLENTFDRLKIPFEEIDLLTTDTNVKTKLQGSQTNYFIVTHFDFNNIDDLHQLTSLHSAREQSKSKINFIYVSSQDPFQHQAALSHYPFSKKIFANVIHFPYATPSELNLLLEENQTRFKVALPTALHPIIYQLSGGCPFLVKNIVKYYSTHRQLPSLADPEFKTLVHHLISRLDPKVIADNDSLAQSALLKQYLASYRPAPPLIIDSQNQKIYLNNVDITHKLLSKESDILFDLKNKGKLTREEIGNICFRNDDLFVYSDYSIDKIVSRLRLKLKKLGIPSTIIQTQKKYGYSLRV